MVCHWGIVVEHGILPVRPLAVGIGVGIDGGHARVHGSFVHHQCIGRGIEHIAALPRLLPTVGEVVVHRNLAQPPALGGDDDHTIGRPCTVDGTRGGVFEHFHALDVAGVDVVNVAFHGHSVDDEERIGVVDGAHTAHPDPGSGSGLAGGRGDGDAGGESLQGVIHARGGCELQIVRAHLGNGGCDDALFLHAIAHNHHLVDEFGVFL